MVLTVCERKLCKAASWQPKLWGVPLRTGTKIDWRDPWIFRIMEKAGCSCLSRRLSSSDAEGQGVGGMDSQVSGITMALPHLLPTLASRSVLQAQLCVRS